VQFLLRASRALTIVLVLLATQLTPTLPSFTVDGAQSIVYQQPASTTPYVSAFQVQANLTDPAPFVIYPLNSKTAWVLTTNRGPFLSQIINFTVGAPPRMVLNTTADIGSIAVDRQGRVWFASNQGLGYYDPATAKAQNVTFPGEYSWFVTTDGLDRVWITLGSNKIAMYDPSSGRSATFAVPTPNAILQGITIAPDGTVWFAETGARKLGRLDLSELTIAEYTSPELVAPIQVAVDNTGTVWFTDHGNNEFGSLNPKTGVWREYPIGYCPGTTCSIGLPNAISLDGNGKVWFSEHLPGRIARLDPESDVLTEYTIPPPRGNNGLEYAYAWCARVGQYDSVWFTAFGYGEIGYVNSSVPVPFTISAPTELTVPKGLAAEFPLVISNQGQRTASVGVSTTRKDANLGKTPFLLGSYLPSVQLGIGTATVGMRVRASSDAPLGSRLVMVTVSDGQVSVSVPVKLKVVETYLPYFTIGTVLAILLAGVILLIRRQPRKVPPISTSEDKSDLDLEGENLVKAALTEQSRARMRNCRNLFRACP